MISGGNLGERERREGVSSTTASSASACSVSLDALDSRLRLTGRASSSASSLGRGVEVVSPGDDEARGEEDVEGLLSVGRFRAEGAGLEGVGPILFMAKVDREGWKSSSSAVWAGQDQLFSPAFVLLGAHLESCDEVALAVQEDGALIGANVDVVRVWARGELSATRSKSAAGLETRHSPGGN